MHIPTKTLLVLLTAFQFCSVIPNEQATGEFENWKSLSQATTTTVTQKEIDQAQKAYNELKQKLKALSKKRTRYLEQKSPAYKELKLLIKNLTNFRKKHKKELEKATQDCPYNKEIIELQKELSQAWFTLDQLQFSYKTEHQKPYYRTRKAARPSLSEVTEMAKKAPIIKVVPGQILDDTTSPRLPALPTPQGSIEPSINRQVKSYYIVELPVRRDHACKRGLEFEMRMNYVSNNNPTDMVGGSAGANYYTLTIGKDACPGSRNCIVQNHVNGDHSVLFTFEVVASADQS